MQVKFSEPTALATRLMAAVLPLIKGSQAKVMALTADLDLSLSQVRILLELERTGEALAVNDLAARISLSIAAAGRAIDALYRSGLVTRQEDESDRRVKRIGLADRGSAVIMDITQVRRQVVESFVAALTDEERVALESAVVTIAALTYAHFPTIDDSTESFPRVRPSE